MNDTPDWAALRAEFPLLARCTYLNTAGRGALPLAVAQRIGDYGRRLTDDPAYGTDAVLAEADGVRRRVERALGAAGGVTFVANATAGMTRVARLLQGRGGVLLAAGDFPAVTQPWLGLGYTARVVEPRADGSIALEDLDRARGPDTRIVALGSVQYASGFRFDPRALGEYCRDRGLALVLDVTQEFGAFPVSVRDSGAQALVFSGYKWALAGYGAGVLYLDPELREAQEPEAGHPPAPGVLALDAALDVLEGIGIERIAARVRALTQELRGRLAGRGLAHRPGPAHLSGITSIAVPDADAAVTALRQRGIVTSARSGRLRISLHFYNDRSDIDALNDALEGLQP
jgi:selenocysteine lyase/cysteine desulfurase